MTPRGAVRPIITFLPELRPIPWRKKKHQVGRIERYS